jgi:hypothetical protein
LLYSFLIGLIGGIVSTSIMTLTEIPSWKRWGLHGVFEWHENQILSNRLLRLSDRKGIHFGGIFFLHFLNGTLAGIAFPFIVSFFYILGHYNSSLFTWNTLWHCTMDSYISTYS